jgi:hypothetical protein
MTNYEPHLRTLLNYYQKTRRVGHTHTLLKGVESSPEAAILTHSDGRAVATLFPKGAYLIPAMETDNLIGMHRPLAVDNSGMLEILRMALITIGTLEQEVRDLRSGRANGHRS